MPKLPLERFVISDFHKHLRAHGMTPAEFAAASGLAVLTIKRLNHQLPTSKAAADKALVLLRVMGSDADLKELSSADLATLKSRRKSLKARRKGKPHSKR